MLKRLAARLPVTLTTFLFGILVTAALTRVITRTSAPAPRCDEHKPLEAAPPAPAKVAPPATASDRWLGQRETIIVPGVGRVRVSADETPDQNLRLVFEDAESGELLLEEQFYGDDDRFKPDAEQYATRPFARFRVLHVKGLPDPLIVGIADSPGGSDCYWEAFAVGAVNGKLEELTREHLNAEDEGGFFFGDLGAGRGLGVASWDFIWGDESHISPHQYELKVYRWNQKSGRFEWHQVLRTHGKFDDGEKAVRSLGFRLTDVRKSFPDFADFGSE